MFLAKKICQDNGCVGYVSDSHVFHIHDETWAQIKIRYEREAIALQKIMPEIKISIYDLVHFVAAGVLEDTRVAIRERVFFKEIFSILMFRFFQYYGSYKGNHVCRKLSNQAKIKYFYPVIKE